MALKADVWSQIHDESNPRAKAWMDAYEQFNASLAYALGELREQPQDIQGRDEEIALLHSVLERPITPVALLLGQAGVGKTALVEEFAKQLNSGQYATHTDNRYMLFALRLGRLSGLDKAQLQSALSTILDDMKKLELAAQKALNDPRIRVVLFIDEVHMLVTIFGPGTKVGGDVIKDVLARAPIRVIAATTRREYDSTIAVDKPLAERFKQIELRELPPEIVQKIAQNWWEKVAPDCEMPEDDVFAYIIKANAMYRSDSAEPRKSLDILEDLVSYERRTREVATRETVVDIFKKRYSINLSFAVDADEVYAEIERRIKGQPFALNVLKRLLRATVFQLDDTTNKPILTALFTGPTGVGKSETTKAIAEKLYPGEPVLLNINMPDYKTPEHEPAFRKRIGEAVRHTPNTIVLLDEFEKAHETVRDSMLTILDEGIITFEVINREGAPEVNSVSLRNTIVIATTNAGAEVFANDAKFSQRNARGRDELTDISKAEVNSLLKTLEPNLMANGFKPEMLGRFNRIVPYRGLSADTLLTIAENEFQKIVDALWMKRGIKILTNEPRQWPKDQYDFVTKDIPLYIAFVKAHADDTNSGGARAIKREMQSAVYDEIIDVITSNPDYDTFKVEVSRDASIYNPGAASTEGGVIVSAVSKRKTDDGDDDDDEE